MPALYSAGLHGSINTTSEWRNVHEYVRACERLCACVYAHGKWGGGIQNIRKEKKGIFAHLIYS